MRLSHEVEELKKDRMTHNETAVSLAPIDSHIPWLKLFPHEKHS